MKRQIAYLAWVLLTIISCSKENQLQNEEQSENPEEFEVTITSTLLTDYEIPEKDIESLQKIGFAGSVAQVFENHNINTNEHYISYLLEGDIEFKAKELKRYIPEKFDKNIHSKAPSKALSRQFRTNTIVIPGNYYIVTTGFVEPTLSAGIDQAIGNYNSLNLSIRFERRHFPGVFGREFSRFLRTNDNYIWIKPSSLNSGSGTAGFPFANGNIFTSIKIDSRIGQTFGSEVAEHVVTHEIGHCIGLRHTNFFNRNCASSPGDEGQGSFGAIHIPGTPERVNIDLNSIMLACYNAERVKNTTKGEFSNFDIIALRALW